MSLSSKPTITICSSANFYRQAIDIKEQLEQLGYTVIVPIMALHMQESGDFEVSHHKTWFADPNDYHKKGEFMRGHFREVANGDAILVLNFEKHGVQNYIGGNVLMEMALAFWLEKPIFIFNEIPNESPFLEEIKGMQPTALHGVTKTIDETYGKS